MALKFQILIFCIFNVNYAYFREVLNYDLTDNIVKGIAVNNTAKKAKQLVARRGKETDDDEPQSSSSLEFPNFKKEWKDVYWLKKQFEVLQIKNQTMNETTPSGVNMIAARPWGVRCGDPSMHDMPWGTCMLPMECEPEFRIWRGDYFCGRTQFVCCAIEETSYDLYKGFDASFASSFETDTEERNERDRKDSKKDKSSAAEKKRRQRDRRERKRIIRKKIRQIVKEVNKLLNKIYKNGTREKHKKTKQMKHFIKELKTQYKKDRIAMKDIHEIEFIKIDARLRDRLEEIRLLNVNFMKNDTFREVILNGTLSLTAARMLVEAYPELESYFGIRRSMSPTKKDYMDYDVEYGLLYN